MKKLTSTLALFSSFSTLICCALPALLVALGLGAAFAGLISVVPQLVWFSEHKLAVFSIGGVMLLIAGTSQLIAKQQTCPETNTLKDACATTKDWSFWLFIISLVCYASGAFFAFGLG